MSPYSKGLGVLMGNTSGCWGPQVGSVLPCPGDLCMGPSGGSGLKEQLGDESGRPGVFLKHGSEVGH